jgi:hypothetical protein
MAEKRAKTSKCRECTNLEEGYCRRRKRGRNRVHPGKPRRCEWFSARA